MGFLIGKGNEDLQEFETTNQDIKFNEFKNLERSINKSGQAYSFKEKGEFSYEFQFMNETYYRNLLYLCKNRSSLREGMLLVPIPYSFSPDACILKPTFNTTNKYYYGLSIPTAPPWNTKLADLTNVGEITEAQYGYIRVEDANTISLPPAALYRYFLAQFDLSSFIGAFSYKDIRRLTLAYHGMNCSPMRFFLWSPRYEQWYLVNDHFYYDDTAFSDPNFYKYKQLMSSFALPWGNTSIYTDFIDGSNKITWMIAQGNINSPLLVQYVRLLINGFWVMATDPQDFENYSTSFTGAGRNGKLTLTEL